MNEKRDITLAPIDTVKDILNNFMSKDLAFNEMDKPL